MNSPCADDRGFCVDMQEFYRHVIRTLSRARVPFLVGGAYAFQCYTAIARHTKDLDLFLERETVPRALHVLRKAGIPGQVVFPHWIAKAWNGEYFVDLIFGSGNGIVNVDQDWFRYAVPSRLVGLSVKLCPAEEMIWSKSFVMERERFDGADIAHLLKERSAALDWPRLLDRFAEDWRVLLAHLVLFGYVYPEERDKIPRAVMGELLSRVRSESTLVNHAPHACLGPLLSRAQYLPDLEEGYPDPRLPPGGSMTPEDLNLWTRGIEVDGPDAIRRTLS